jgi:hypothetical protein
MNARNNFRWLGALAVVASTLFTAVNVSAYVLMRTQTTNRIIKWDPGTVTMRVRVPNSGTLQDGTTYSTSIRAAMDAWNTHLGKLRFAAIIESPGSGSDGNSSNEIFFSNTVYGQAFGSSTLAVATTWTAGTRPDNTAIRAESDVIFNTAKTWDSYPGVLQTWNGGPMDIRRVAIHELGHVLGLDHPDQYGQGVLAIMNSTVSSDVPTLVEDDIEGGQFLYGAAATTARPPNNLFANATVATLSAASAQFSGSNVGAYKEHEEPFHAPSEPGGSSVWWRWTAPVSGSLTVHTRTSSFDTMLAAYTGSSVGALTQLASNDDEQAPGSVPESERLRTSIITFNVTEGTTYSIAVDGWDGEQGSISLTLQLTSRPVILTQPTSQTTNAGANVTFTVNAYGSGTVSYQWRKGGANIPGATASSYTLNGVSAGDAASYDVVVSNNLGSTTSSAATLTINQATQTITFEAPSQLTYGTTPFTLNASASSGLPVAFSVESGPGTLNGSQLTVTNVGTVRVRASQSGNGSFLPAPDVLRDITVVPAPATVHLANLTATYDGTPKSATVTTNPAGLSTSVTYNGSVTPPTNAGSYTLSATITDPRYQGSISNTFTIAKATQTITFATLPDLPFTTTPLTLNASASSGLPVSFTVLSGSAELTGTSLQLTGAGTVTVRATQLGNANYEPAAAVDRSFVVEVNFAAWQLAHFTENELNFPAISGPNADPDGDGLANLIEYALGLPPRQAHSGSPVELVTDSATFQFIYLRPSGRGDITYSVQASSDLVNWSEAGLTHVQTGTEGDRERWTATRSTASPLFFRLRVTRN